MSHRLHLAEFEDFAWFPASMRDLMTDALSAMQRRFRMHDTMAALLEAALREADTREVLDLCSGAGGVLPQLQKELERKGLRVRVTFSDRYPNERALAAACAANPEQLRFHAQAIDATDIPAELGRFRTLFTSFHHFRPREAEAILRSAHADRAGIAIFEITERSFTAFLRNALTPVVCWVITPKIRPLTWQRLLFTYVIPIVPAALTWDGFVSNLRTYTTSELEQLTSSLRTDDYEWRVGKSRGALGQVTTFLIGLHRPHSTSQTSNTQTRKADTNEKERSHVSL